jgi:hypothetical protein
MKIGQLFLADIERDINPVIKVDDLSQAELRNELEDYVVTEVIEKYLLDCLEHYTDARQKETDRVGIWISGYVGSGKSHFAKILGLVTENPQVEGRSAIDRFRPRLATCRAARELERHLYEIATFLRTEVIAFQINSVAIKGAEDDVCSILYRQFLAHRGLSTDISLARLIEEPLLEREAFDAFRQSVRELTDKSWEEVRKRPMFYWGEIFEALARTLPDKFQNAQEAQEAYDRSRSVIQPTFEQLAKDLATYVARQQARHREREMRLLFIIDELGQFVADSGARLLDIQSFAEEIATHGKGKIWLVVTSHESMHDVVKNAREFKGDIKKLEGRFYKRYTLTTENIERVLEERLFKKSKAGEDVLQDVYRRRGGALKDAGELVKADRALPTCDVDRFVACYPFLPYQLTLIPDVLHGLRVAGGRGEALTGAARSLLGITQGVLKHHGYAQSEVGRLVPLDEVYAEIEDAEIPSEVRRELNSVGAKIPDQIFPLHRILRVLYLLQQIPYAPRTLDNLARLLVSSIEVDLAALRSQVERGLEQLIAARYVAKAGDQYEYLSGERKRIEEEIAQQEVRTIDKRDKLTKDFLTATNLEVGPVRYEDAYRFDVRVLCDDQVIVSKGGIEVRMISPLKAWLDGVSAEDLEGESLATSNTLYWLARPSSAIERLLDRIVRLERVVSRYEADPAKSKELTDVVREKRRELDEILKPELIQELKTGFRQGQFIFRGNAHAAEQRIDRLGRLFSTEVSAIIPKVYTQFDKAKHTVADERKAIEAIFTAPPSRLHQIEPLLALFDKQGGLNRSSRALDDVYSFLEAEARRGNIVTGKMLVDRYEGIPFGWDSNIARLCAAALFRSGALVLTLDKRDYRDPRDAEAQQAFLNSHKFNRAELRLESDLELSVEERMRAREQMHLLFNARPEETPAALAETLQQKLQEHLAALRELAEWVRLTGFPTPSAYTTAAESFEKLVEERRPNTCVRQFLTHLDEVSEQIRVTARLHAFFSSPHRDEYERARTLVSALRQAVDEGLATEPMRIALVEYDGRSRDRELLDRWSEVHGFLLSAVSDLQDLYSRLHQNADEAYRAVATRVQSDATDRGLDSDDEVMANLVAAASQHVCGQVSAWTPESGYRCNRCGRDLMTLINAPLAAERLKDRLIRQLQEQLVTRASLHSDGPIAVAPQVRTIRVADVIATPRVRKLAEWETARDQLDKVVREALQAGDEVDLR